MEKENTREMERRLREYFKEREVIPLKEMADWIGCSDRVLKNDRSFPVKKIKGRYFATVTATARFLA